jgi:ABC-type dipeptide/oligopeptide/nickel transport system permease component
VTSRDLAVVQAALIVIAFSIVFFNLLVDILYGVVNPKVRTGDVEARR